MLYVKTRLNDQVEIKVELYDDEIFTSCVSCGKEMQVEPEEVADIINEGCDFVGTSFYCPNCLPKDDKTT